MLKFFRKYNKYILAVGGAFLMVAFLVGPTVTSLMPGPASMTVGTVDGEDITRGDLNTASAEMNILARISPILLQLAMSGEREPLQWALLVREARELGLDASDSEINSVLAIFDINPDEGVNRIAREAGVPPVIVRQSLRHWLMLQHHRELAWGLGHLSLDERLNLLQQAMMAQQYGAFQFVNTLFAASLGRPRISPELVNRLVYDNAAQADVSYVLVDPLLAYDELPDAQPEQVQEMFEAHKDDLPGTSEPYGFGYRKPDRVKLEYLRVPYDQIRREVVVDEADALTYYEDHKQDFVEQPRDATGQTTGQGRQQDYSEVRSQIVELLKDEQAERLAESMAKEALAILLDDARSVPRGNSGYRDVPEDFTPMPLRQVAEELELRHGVRPDVEQRTDGWLTAQDLEGLPGIAQAQIPGDRPVGFVPYVLSARELEPERDNPLVTLRLQAGLPSRPLVGGGMTGEGDRYLFRVTEASAEHSPDTLDEVRDQVEADVVRKLAYEKLVDEKDTWQARAVNEGLDSIATELGVNAYTPPPFPRRQGATRGMLVTPRLPGVGASENVVDAAFSLAAGLDNPLDVPSNPDAQRVAAVAVPEQQQLVVLRLDGFNPVTEQVMRASASQDVYFWINPVLLSEAENPLSPEAVEARINYESATEDEEEDNSEEVAAG